MSRQKNLMQELMHPGTEFSPVPFWFFNDAFDEKRVREQLEDYVKKGVGGFVLHPRIGVPEDMPYLSESYFDAVKFIVKTAAELDMKVVLYDEGMYPSGSAHGKVVEANPEYASKGIHLVESVETSRADANGIFYSEKGREQIIARLEDGTAIAYGFTGGTIRGIHFGEDDGEAGAPKSADILNPDAVDEFIRLTHDAYYAHLKEYFGNTVIAFFTDEPCALGRNAGLYREWTPGLEKELAAAGGKAEELAALFAKTGKAVAGREDIVKVEENPTVVLYHQLIKKKLREVFYARLSAWCENHGISFIGHPAESDDIEEELYFHIPGQDLIMRRVAPETGGLREFDSVQAKLTADLARHLGRPRNANECFGVCYRKNIPWYFTAGDMKWYIDWLGLRGVNFYIPHAFYYSVTGERKGERPPDVGPNNIWWKHYRRISDYIKRLSFLMTDSENGAKVAVLCDNNKVPYEEIACLYEEQIEFNYLPAALLDKAEVRDGKVWIQGLSYAAVLNVLGEAYQRRFADKLGTLLLTDADSVVNAPEIYRPDFCMSGSCSVDGGDESADACRSLRKVHLTKRGVELYLFGNEGAETICRQVTLPGVKAPLFMDLWAGKCYTVEGAEDTFTLYLQPSETVLVIDGGTAEEPIPGCTYDAVSASALADREAFVERRRADWFQKEYPDWTDRFTVQEKSDNVITYVCHETADSVTGEECFSVRGAEMVECYCNGAFVDVSLWGVHRFEIGGFLREGDNEIKLVVTGNAANVYEKAGIPFGLDHQAVLPDGSILMLSFLQPNEYFKYFFRGEEYRVIGKNDVDCYVGIASNQQVFILEPAICTRAETARYIAVDFAAFIKEIDIYQKWLGECEAEEDSSEEQRKEYAEGLRKQILSIDASAFCDENTYWSVIAEQAENDQL